jgi:hypothetical protein
MENKEPIFVPGVLFKEFDTKFGKGFNITFTSDFLDFLMARIYENPKGVETTFFKKKNPTKYTTHYGKINDNTYTSGIKETFSEESTDNTSKIDPDMDLDIPF